MKIILIIGLLYCLNQLTFAQQKYNPNPEAQKAYNRASVYIDRKMYDKALDLLNEAIRMDSNFIEAYQQLGDIYRKIGAYNLAKENYKKVLQINPNFLALTYYGIA